ncbi:UNVERIFIED_CONTAM: Ran-binding protein 17 [Gekko kuhli]
MLFPLTSSTYILLKKLVKIDAVKFMLQNHTSKHFPFLGANDNYCLSDLRCRTTFYTALTRLLMVDLGEDEDEFENFMLPLTVSFATLAQIFNNSFKQEEAKVGCIDQWGKSLLMTDQEQECLNNTLATS